MPPDLMTLAEACGVGLPEVQASLLISADGVLAVSHPVEEQMRTLAAWHGVCGMGAVRRGFVALGRGCWAFVVRERGGVLALVSPTPRPGVILARLDRILDLAEPLLDAGSPGWASGDDQATEVFPTVEGLDEQRMARTDGAWDRDALALVNEFAGLLEGSEALAADGAAAAPAAEEPPPPLRVAEGGRP